MRLTARQAQKLLNEINSKRVHKYNARRTLLDIDGKVVAFPSKAEAARFAKLLQFQAAGMISGLRRQVPVELTVNGRRVCRMVWDAVYVRDNRMHYEDTKGARNSAAYRVFAIKRELFLALFPNVVVIEVHRGKESRHQ